MSTTQPPSFSPKSASQDKQPLHQAEENVHPLVYQQRCKDMWIAIFAFRVINALVVRTFFQPDEYFQSLEPAWQMVFGSQSGAWITWEWEHQLRSSLHPALFAGFYYVASKIMAYISCFPQFQAMILSVLPNLVQAVFATGTDYHTWQLADKIYGRGSNAGWAALFMTLCSPWNWFCSTRTFSNCMETELTIGALDFWPWGLSSEERSGSNKEKNGTRTSVLGNLGPESGLRGPLTCAFLAIVLRPTNGLIWFTIMMPVLTGIFSSRSRLPMSDYVSLIREALVCGVSVLLVSAASDRLYFGEWTFPPYQWLNFNISQDLAVFYGCNDFHYYLSQGLPLLLTTYLPFTLVALWKTSALPATNIRFILLTTVLFTISTLSLISHKEVRFIYPLLPLLHILTAPTVASFFTNTTTTTTKAPRSTSSSTTSKTTSLIHKPLLALFLGANLLIGGYTTLSHQQGVVSVLSFLRHEYESLHLDQFGKALPASSDPLAISSDETFAAFLMPCHSTPWRSRLFYPTLKAWALTCDPPLHLAARTEERLAYRDEADRFYDNTAKFLSEEVGGRERPWPRYVVGFQGIEGPLRQWYEGGGSGMKGWKMNERWRGHNTDWIDDWRREGDVVVWEFVDGSSRQ
ncbi:glycosyltransferase family 22 protein [Amylocarpus encephaloides]|uniref:Mannosyltransferase n=1 Tax=Amylocarpus encephaloides TaxID=45428 RepID=A0A9P7YL51_9HELO|nr:glycosyltransferase family 22 protein [Amylocarpus encephaloides]